MSQPQHKLRDDLELEVKRLLSELETLKAQLATANGRIKWLEGFGERRFNDAKRFHDQLQVSEAQVRELRQALDAVRFEVAYSLEHDNAPQTFKARLGIMHTFVEAALRSAPPSGSQSDKTTKLAKQYCYEPFPMHLSDKIYFCDLAKGHDGMHRSASLGLKWPRNDAWDRMQAPFDKTDAWEERKDLARQSSDVGERASYPSQVPESPATASEQFPAAPDGFTGSREAREHARKSSTADKSVEYSGPQDEQLWFCEACNMLGKAFIKPGAGVYEGVYALEDSHETLSPECDKGIGKMRVHNPDVISREEFVKQAAPPSPAREKEKAE